MIVTVSIGTDPSRVAAELTTRGLWTRRLQDGTRTLFVVEPHSREVDPEELRTIAGVESVALPPSPHPLLDAQPTLVDVSGVQIGAGAQPVLMAGPCSVESEEQIRQVAASVRRAGASFLRGGAYKPRTSPYAFTGHGERALRWLRDAADAHGLRVVTEAMSEADTPAVAEHSDLVQIGSRNMQNFALLRAAGRTGKPVLLKRGMSATVEEWLMAAEHCLVHGARAVIFCERGIRGFDTTTRNLLDLGAVALLSHVRGLPVIVDPSHATGRRDLVAPLSRAALAAGAAGLLIETHPSPAHALSDGPQALAPDELQHLSQSLGAFAAPHAA